MLIKIILIAFFAFKCNYVHAQNFLKNNEAKKVLKSSGISEKKAKEIFNEILDDNKIPNPDAQPLRNEAGFFIAVEDPYENNVNLKDPDQLIKLDKKTTTYVYDPYWSLILDREFKEL